MGQRQYKVYDELLRARSRIAIHLNERAQAWQEASAELALIDDEIAQDVQAARRLHMEWKDIAAALGIPRQTVQNRYASYGNRQAKATDVNNS